MSSADPSCTLAYSRFTGEINMHVGVTITSCLIIGEDYFTICQTVKLKSSPNFPTIQYCACVNSEMLIHKTKSAETIMTKTITKICLFCLLYYRLYSPKVIFNAHCVKNAQTIH